MRHTEFLARSLSLSTWISRNWPVEEVLDFAGAHLWMGPGGHGLEAGARHFFGRPLEALTIEDLALLLAVARSPRAYDPACRPDAALRGRSDVLERMRSAGLIDDNALRRAKAASVRVLPVCDRPSEAPWTTRSSKRPLPSMRPPTACSSGSAERSTAGSSR
jgi:membrane peptidoglycan carboxypeptidase